MEDFLLFEEKFKIQLNQLRKQKNLFSNIRLLFFVLTLVDFYFIFSDYSIARLILGVVLLVCFLFFVSKSVKLSREIGFVEDQLNLIEIIKTDDRVDEYKFINDEFFSNIYNKDLDILEGASIFNRINKTQSYIGNFQLKYFLSNILTDKSAIEVRQTALKELEEKKEWMLKFLMFSKRINIDRFVLFEDFNRQFKNINLRFLPIIFGSVNILILLYLAFLGFPKKMVFFWIVTVIPVSFFIQLIFKNRVNTTLSYSFINANQLENLIALAEHIEKESFVQDLNKNTAKAFVNEGKKSSDQLKEMKAALGGFEALGFPIIGFILNYFLLWKLYHTIQFENKVNKVIVNNGLWVENIAIFEALISFAVFNIKFSHFNTPTISDNPNYLNIEEVFHPLLDESIAIKNSFLSDRNQSINIITGANMAGKSTFLRTVGVNLILAMNGLKVSAKAMNFYPMDVFTSIRTADNLSSGDSYFKNEINKLKILIDYLDDNKNQYIILDEILKGTNSKDKLIGSQKFLEKLMKSKTDLVCFIATHDLELTKMEEIYPDNIVNYCFELKNVDQNYISDYKLQKGTTQIMNAIFLMKEFKIIE